MRDRSSPSSNTSRHRTLAAAIDQHQVGQSRLIGLGPVPACAASASLAVAARQHLAHRRVVVTASDALDGCSDGTGCFCIWWWKHHAAAIVASPAVWLMSKHSTRNLSSSARACPGIHQGACALAASPLRTAGGSAQVLPRSMSSQACAARAAELAPSVARPPVCTASASASLIHRLADHDELGHR